MASNRFSGQTQLAKTYTLIVNVAELFSGRMGGKGIPLLCLCMLALSGRSLCSKVLLVLVPGPKSHLFNMKKLGPEIASRGHSVAVSFQGFYTHCRCCEGKVVDKAACTVFFEQ